MKKIQLILVSLVTIVMIQACGGGNSEKKDTVEVAKSINDKSGSQVTDKASDFMVKAASGGMMEVVLGRIAQEKTTNPRVKAFGAMMMKDHTEANIEMKTVADGKNVTLPSKLGDEHQKHVDELKTKSGEEFDKAYISMMVDDHKEDIEEFEEATKLDDADVKALAAKTLPVLRVHLDSAKAINSSLK